MAPPIPAIYYYTFTALDPLICLSSIYMNLFTPHLILAGAFARSSPYATLTPAHTFLHDQFAGVFAMFAFLMLFMLPRLQDVVLWQLFEAGVLWTDVFGLVALWRAVAAQGGEVRGETVVSAVVFAGLGMLRGLFVLGVGVDVGNVVSKGKEKRKKI